MFSQSGSHIVIVASHRNVDQQNPLDNVITYLFHSFYVVMQNLMSVFDGRYQRKHTPPLI